jgi:hypothetical protein
MNQTYSNMKNTQLLLIGARTKDVEEELGVDIDEEKETERSADLFKELRLRREQIPLKPLLKGKFPGKEDRPLSQEVKQLSKEEYPGAKGGKIGGRAAATKSTSAASIAKMLSGVQFPKNKNELIERVKGNKDKVDNAESIIDTVKELPTKTYRSMTDVEEALAEIR